MSSLAGMRILIVEDEPIVAMLVEDMLLELGAEAVGPAVSLESAIAYVDEGGFDAVILDLNLNGERTGPVAEALRLRGSPFVFATGYGSAEEGPTSGSILLQKPYRLDQMERALEAALAARTEV